MNLVTFRRPGWLVTGLCIGSMLFLMSACGGGGSSDSSAATGNSAAGTAPTITTQPLPVNVTAPQAATFSVVAAGSPAPTYQWQFSVDGGASFSNISGAVSASYTTPATTASDNGKQFHVVVTNATATVTSSAAALTVNSGPASVSTTARIATGGSHTCAIKPDQTLACWGFNGAGQLGDGTKVDRLTATAVPGLTGVTDLVAGLNHTCALKSDRTVYCWGNAGDGEMGDGYTGPGVHPDVTSPAIVPGSTGVTALASGGYHVCALKADATVVCWGLNTYGQLGDGSTTSRASPVAVTGLSNVVKLSAGLLHTCAQKADATVACWGDNRNGALGDGTLTARSVPTAVPGLTGVVDVRAGSNFSCAQLSSGGLSCWGQNASGALGDGTTVTRTSPTAVTGLTGAVASVSPAGGFGCALYLSGTAACWGVNSAGELGDGTSTGKSVPTPVPGLSGLVALSYGPIASHACAVKSDGSAVCWGADANGQLGISTSTVSGGVLQPTAVLNLTVLH